MQKEGFNPAALMLSLGDEFFLLRGIVKGVWIKKGFRKAL